MRTQSARTRRVLASVLAVLTLTLSACANIGTSSSATGQRTCTPAPASTSPTHIDVPTPDHAAQDPRALQGPTTAYTRSDAIIPISDNAASQQSLPATITSADGPDQIVTDTTRILALNQNGGLAAAVIGLGFGCNLVGRDIATADPLTADLPLVTRGGHELSAEAIIALHPTVVITDTTIGPYDVQLQLRDAGIPVIFVPTSSTKGVAGVGEQIRAVADALGVHDLGVQLARRTLEEIGQVVTDIAALAPQNYADRPRAVFLYIRGKSVYYWFGVNSGADSLLQSLSLVDVATETGMQGMTPTNAEALTKAAPDVIITMTLGIASTGGIDDVLALPGIAQTPAGKNRRIIDMSDYEVMSFGPRTPQVLAALGAAIYAPDAAYQPEHAPEAIEKRLEELENAQSGTQPAGAQS